MIKTCTCTHVYQDKTYGKQQRVHTVGLFPIAGAVTGYLDVGK